MRRDTAAVALASWIEPYKPGAFDDAEPVEVWPPSTTWRPGIAVEHAADVNRADPVGELQGKKPGSGGIITFARSDRYFFTHFGDDRGRETPSEAP
jgi:hypothetical protein